MITIFRVRFAIAGNIKLANPRLRIELKVLKEEEKYSMSDQGKHEEDDRCY